MQAVRVTTTEAINAAIQDGNHYGEECVNTFTQGAIIYFPVRPSHLLLYALC
jgi:hypothetical protein